jgi:hypothetical protein
VSAVRLERVLIPVVLANLGLLLLDLAYNVLSGLLALGP